MQMGTRTIDYAKAPPCGFACTFAHSQGGLITKNEGVGRDFWMGFKPTGARWYLPARASKNKDVCKRVNRRQQNNQKRIQEN